MPDGDQIALRAETDIVLVRQAVRQRARELGLSLVDQTKLVTAASELARNALDHGGGGVVRMEVLNHDQRRGLQLHFEDRGPGIADIDQALQDGFTTVGGLGLGLGGARRLVDEFHIRSTPGKGTSVVVTRWK